MDKEGNGGDGDTQAQNPPNLMSGDEGLLEKFKTDHDLNNDQFNKIKEKYKKDKDFSPPNSAAEKVYALDMIID